MINDAIMHYAKERLERDLIRQVDGDTRVGVVKLGPLQGDPDPDVARISIEIYENDPDQEIKGSGISQTSKVWQDEVYEIEIGGTITWRRRFTAKCRCLLEQSREGLEDARRIASSVRSRMEKSILSMRFANIESEGERVCMGPLSDAISGEMVQAGGPPDSYDFMIKVRFEVLTTQSIVEE